MAIFDIFESILLQVGVTTSLSNTKLNMVYNTLKKIFLGSNHILIMTMATMMHPFQKAKMDHNSMKVFFVLKT